MNEPMQEPEAEQEPLYCDENGIPMLFDVVIPGDYLKAAGVFLGARAVAPPQPEPEPEPEPPGPSPEALEAEIRRQVEAALEAALPGATERAVEAMRSALIRELRSALQPLASGTRSPGEDQPD